MTPETAAALHLTLENEVTLPDGGPTSFTVRGRRTVDIGRDQHLDWTLPDPTRFISGKHCEIRYKDGAYWLHDVSTNGTFVNGADQRMRGPHQLRSGDRFIVGHYIVAVRFDAVDSLDGGFSTDAPAKPYPELWSDERDIAPPIDPKELKIRETSRQPDEFLEWAASVPSVDPLTSGSRPQIPPDPDIWGDIKAGPVPAPDVAQRPQNGAEGAEPQSAWHGSSEASRPQTTQDAWASAPALHPSIAQPAVPPSALPPSPSQSAEPAPSSPFFDAGPVPSAAASPRAPAKAGADVSANRSGETDVFRKLAEAAGLPATFFQEQTEDEIAAQLGAILKITVEGLMQLLQARNQAKQITRSSRHTTIQAVENNPLKFSPTAQDALRIMFGPKTRSYLDAQAAFAQSFEDLKSHQLKTYVALQHSITRLLDGLDPASITKEAEAAKGMASLLSSQKAKMWDIYRARWDANLLPGGGGPIAAFMLHFASSYDDDRSAG